MDNGFRVLPYAFHCTDCQTRTGSASSEHMLFARHDLTISGEIDSGYHTQPSGAQSSIGECAVCKTVIFADNNERPGFTSFRCGTLDESAAVVPAAHIWISSKQPWIQLPADATSTDEQPLTREE